MTKQKKFGRMTPIKREDIVCIHCGRNACEAIFSKVCDGAECQTCKKDIREGRAPKKGRLPAYTDRHRCPGCGNFKSMARKTCKRCLFQVDKPADQRAKKVAMDRANLEAWIKARRKRLNQYA